MYHLWPYTSQLPTYMCAQILGRQFFCLFRQNLAYSVRAQHSSLYFHLTMYTMATPSTHLKHPLAFPSHTCRSAAFSGVRTTVGSSVAVWTGPSTSGMSRLARGKMRVYSKAAATPLSPSLLTSGQPLPLALIKPSRRSSCLTQT